MTLKYKNLVFASLAGILLFCSFPPLEYSSLAWIALIPLIYLCFCSQPGRSFLYGLSAGAVFWLASIFWLTRVSFIGWFLISLYCACYFACFALVVSWWFANRRFQSARLEAKPLAGKGRGILRDLPVLFGVPALWVGFEYGRAQFLTGFPWNLLGVSQYSCIALIQCAQWGGVYLVSYLIVMGNTAFALLIYNRREKIIRTGPVLASFLLIVFLVLEYGQWRLGRPLEQLETIRTAAVQLNVPQQYKWSEDWAMDIYRRLKKSAAMVCKSAPPDLMVWPETALPDFVRYGELSREAANETLRHGIPLLIGSMDYEILPGKTNYFNSSFLFLPSFASPAFVAKGFTTAEEAKPCPDAESGQGGMALLARSDASERASEGSAKIPRGLPQEASQGEQEPQVYEKRHLVAFGEYVPCARFLPFLRSIADVEEDFTPGTKNVVFRLNNNRRLFSVLICFEDTLPYLARECVRAGARLLINQTNDAWFDPYWASRQHMTHCVFRCVENRVACLRATNTGLTCYIDRLGVIRSSLAPLGREPREPCSEAQRILQGEPQIMRSAAEFSPENMPLTFYTRHGDLFALACAAFSLPLFIGTLVGFLRKRR
ncbi:MAG: apolipoprotein N-acyltransferase [Kiritimatiellia bacterium]|nr:apolipoprotein N-acyltransferase [Kiritimatiellia bacterium]